MANKKELGYLRLLIDLKSDNSDEEQKINNTDNSFYRTLSQILENLHFEN